MRVLVTGGAGFIGSHIVDTLVKDGHEVSVIDDLSSGSKANVPANVRLDVVDICDREKVAAIMKDVKPELVCHQAAQLSVSRSVREPQIDAQINVLGLLNVVEPAIANGAKRIVFASSGGVLYGNVTEPAPEETPANPISPYGITKWVGERYLKFFTDTHGIETVALRYANVYGPRQNPHGEAGVVAIFSTLSLKGERCRINGDGKYIRDYVYCKDVARANFLALTSDLPRNHCAWNVGTGSPTDVNELAATIREFAIAKRKTRGLSGIVPEPEHGPDRAGDLRSNLVTYDKIQSELGWSPSKNIRAGLAETVDWFADELKI
jgi:UDP-glucose 4-epimerase